MKDPTMTLDCTLDPAARPTAALPATRVGPTRFRCIACGGDRRARRPAARPERPGRPFTLVRCRICGVVQQHPRYTEAEIDRLYADTYYVFAEHDRSRWARAVQQYVVHLASAEPARGRRLLDVGCALGHLAALARARGWRVTGIDISAAAVRRTAERFGIDARTATLVDLRNSAGRFDTVFLGDVIEHVLHPTVFLDDARRLLTPGGRVCIDTPNWGSRWRRFAGRRWLGLNRYHTNLFDAAAMRRLLDAAGFTDIRTTGYTHYRYESWADRPEIQTHVHKLPAPLAWRVNRLLAARRHHGRWAGLRTRPPETLEAAVDCIDALARRTTCVASPRADNLVAMAQPAT